MQKGTPNLERMPRRIHGEHGAQIEGNLDQSHSARGGGGKQNGWRLKGEKVKKKKPFWLDRPYLSVGKGNVRLIHSPS